VGSAAGGHLPLAGPAISAAGISLRQPTLPAWWDRQAAIAVRSMSSRRRIGARTFCDHQVLAVFTALTRCRLAVAASSPGSDRIE